MPKKIRVYELAKELGLTNKEGLELALSLGIGVKSHSSSIEDAQADRVRRKADAEGLRRPVQPEEPAPAKKAAERPRRPYGGDGARPRGGGGGQDGRRRHVAPRQEGRRQLELRAPQQAPHRCKKAPARTSPRTVAAADAAPARA